MLLKIENVKKYFVKKNLFTKKELTKAVDNISFNINEGESFGLVGESGSGKTTLARLIIGIEPLTSGNIFFKNKNLFNLPKNDAINLYKKISIVFQNPFSSLNPKNTIRDIISEPLDVFNIGNKEERTQIVIDLLNRVGLSKEQHLYRYPHEFSGGQCQRIAIARALSYNPQFFILDEPTSALDVSVQAQILNLLKEIQKEMKITFLLISHDMGVIHHMCNRVGVMYQGKLVEVGFTDDIFKNCFHQYTKLLIQTIPDIKEKFDFSKELKQEAVTSNNKFSVGCKFAPRCPNAEPKCFKKEPQLKEVKPGHRVACFYLDK